MVKRKLSTQIFSVSFFIFLVIYVVSLLVPFIWALITSLKTLDDFAINSFGLPEKWMFSNYIDVFSGFRVPLSDGDFVYFVPLFANGLLYAVLSTAAIMIVNCMAAYVIAKYDSIFTKFIYAVVIAAMVIPTVGSLAAGIQLMRAIGLHDSFFGLVIRNAALGGMNFLILYAIFKGVSWGYAEAAFVDGAGHFTVFVKLMLPLVVPTVLSLGVLSFITFWNDWQTPLVFMPSFPTIAYGLYMFQSNSYADTAGTPMLMCATVLVVVPVLILFLIFREKMMSTITVGGLKG